jgi:glucoamylase
MDVLQDPSSFSGANASVSFINPIMHLFSSAVLLGAAALHSVFARPGLSDVHTVQLPVLKQSVEDFIQSETPIALERLLCNIGADGCHASGVSHGLVIASPSKEAPPCKCLSLLMLLSLLIDSLDFYTWTRDSALVFKSLVDRFVNSYDADLQRRIMEYIAAQSHLQGLSNPSGDLSDGSGLGEPKFNVDESAFTDNWGRSIQY